MTERLLQGAFLAAALSFAVAPPALAQFGDEQSISGDSTGSPTPKTDRPAAVFVLPDPFPAPPPFEAMVPFESDGQTTMRFALDPASLQLRERSAQVTIAALSASGALNVGYYGFDCEDVRYQHLAYATPDGVWQPVSRQRWREVRDGETRNRQYRAVYGAVCQLGGMSTATVDEVIERLSDPNKRLYLPP